VDPAWGGTSTSRSPEDSIPGGLPPTSADDALQPLTAREQEVLEMVAAEQSTSAIASALGLSQHTVRKHVHHLLSKLVAHSKLEAVMIAAGAHLARPFVNVGPKGRIDMFRLG
jgi:DNA-binding NarL/FixJ family response regulator